jgi:preprotein translocase subunit SecB
MMMQNQLKASPLTIEYHVFRSIQIDAADVENPQGPHNLRTRRRVERNQEEPRRWMVILDVEFESVNEAEPTPYTGKICVQGWFTVADFYPEDKQNLLIEVTAASILYGACREMIASFTARSTHGTLSLPSVSFEPIKRAELPEQTDQKKSAKKKTARPSVAAKRSK